MFSNTFKELLSEVSLQHLHFHVNASAGDNRSITFKQFEFLIEYMQTGMEWQIIEQPGADGKVNKYWAPFSPNILYGRARKTLYYSLSQLNSAFINMLLFRIGFSNASYSILDKTLAYKNMVQTNFGKDWHAFFYIAIPVPSISELEAGMLEREMDFNTKCDGKISPSIKNTYKKYLDRLYIYGVEYEQDRDGSLTPNPVRLLLCDKENGNIANPLPETLKMPSSMYPSDLTMTSDCEMNAHGFHVEVASPLGRSFSQSAKNINFTKHIGAWSFCPIDNI